MTRHFIGNQSFTGSRPLPADELDRRLPGAKAAIPEEPLIAANLVAVGGSNDGALFPIPKEGLTLGRLPDNDVVIDDPWVSRRHAEIVPNHDSYFLRDLSSSNGTYLTDRLIDASDYGLQDGDHIRLGRCDVQLVFRFSGAATLRMAPQTGGASGEGVQSPDRPRASWQAQQAAESHDPEAVSPADNTWPDESGFREEMPSGGEMVGEEVRLDIEAGGDVRLMFQFVHELRQRPELIVLRMSGGPKQDMAVWIGLVSQVPLSPLLSRIKFVSTVGQMDDQATGGQAPCQIFNVRLAI
jgi:pSer/pThr/pTyr-binding forkhead associated (FHA) protein